MVSLFSFRRNMVPPPILDGRTFNRRRNSRANMSRLYCRSFTQRDSFLGLILLSLLAKIFQARPKAVCGLALAEESSNLTSTKRNGTSTRSLAGFMRDGTSCQSRLARALLRGRVSNVTQLGAKKFYMITSKFVAWRGPGLFGIFWGLCCFFGSRAR